MAKFDAVFNESVITSEMKAVIHSCMNKLNVFNLSHDVRVQFTIDKTNSQTIAMSTRHLTGLHTINLGERFMKLAMDAKHRGLLIQVICHELAHVVEKYYQPFKNVTHTAHGKNFRYIMTIMGFTPSESKSTVKLPSDFDAVFKVQSKTKTRYVWRGLVSGNEFKTTKKAFDWFSLGKSFTIQGENVEFLRIEKFK
jgi:predicted SprT family Zn-dependent metalloprotease